MTEANAAPVFSNDDDSIIPLVGAALDAAASHNTKLIRSGEIRDKSVTSFHATCDPHISMADYNQRINRYSGASPSCYMCALVLMDRVTKQIPDFLLSYYNVHRLYVVCLLLATKFMDERFYSNRHWSRIAGISLAELNLLEVEVLQILDWKMYISTEEYQEFFEMATAAAGTKQDPKDELALLLQDSEVSSSESECSSPCSSASTISGLEKKQKLFFFFEE